MPLFNSKIPPVNQSVPLIGTSPRGGSPVDLHRVALLQPRARISERLLSRPHGCPCQQKMGPDGVWALLPERLDPQTATIKGPE